MLSDRSIQSKDDVFSRSFIISQTPIPCLSNHTFILQNREGGDCIKIISALLLLPQIIFLFSNLVKVQKQ